MICRYKIKFISDIEQKIRKLLVNIAVAPFVGVWIEIYEEFIYELEEEKSLPSWECGLKSRLIFAIMLDVLSLPSWECGLKSANPLGSRTNPYKSLPSWECGLK